LSWTLVFTETYNRRAARFLRRHPDLRKTYHKTLLLLEVNPHHPSLRLHALKGKLRGLHSVSINISYLITLELLIEGQRLIPIHIGGHDTVCLEPPWMGASPPAWAGGTTWDQDAPSRLELAATTAVPRGVSRPWSSTASREEAP
jgi:mRNA-degrading endonuclease YafQ of YafQ-DinJ toxin-antitoxin module